MERGTTPFIVWNTDYSVVDEALDAQHQEIFDIINKIYSQMRSGITREEIRHRLEEVKAYARKHFRAEETAMRACGYPDLETHQLAHRKYEQDVQSLIMEQARQGEALAYDLMAFLKNWWKGHVTKLDQRYAPFLREPCKTGRSDTIDS
jgi:hemerythrin